MPSFPRASSRRWCERWLEANRRCEEARRLAAAGRDLHGRRHLRLEHRPERRLDVVGPDQIRDIALGLEMDGLEGWSYQYQRVLIDDKQGEVVGFWKQIVDESRTAAGYEVYGIGGSWFRYGGDWQWEWQRDFFDFGNVDRAVHGDDQGGRAVGRDAARMQRAVSGEKLPGHFPLAGGPVPLW